MFVAGERMDSRYWMVRSGEKYAFVEVRTILLGSEGYFLPDIDGSDGEGLVVDILFGFLSCVYIKLNSNIFSGFGQLSDFSRSEESLEKWERLCGFIHTEYPLLSISFLPQVSLLVLFQSRKLSRNLFHEVGIVNPRQGKRGEEKALAGSD